MMERGADEILRFFILKVIAIEFSSQKYQVSYVKAFC